MQISSLLLTLLLSTLALCSPHAFASSRISRDVHGRCSGSGQTLASCTVKQSVLFQQVRLVVDNSNVSAIQCLLHSMYDNLDSPSLWKAWPIGNTTSVGVGFNVQQQTAPMGYLLSLAGLLGGTKDQWYSFCK